jgi:uncharacterized cupredoxin-like copper-binding protein
MSVRNALLVLALLPLVGSCRTDAAEQDGDDFGRLAAAPPEVVIRTRDFQFLDVPLTVLAGITTIRLINEGPDFHHVWLVRLEDGHTLDDALDVFAAGGPQPDWMVDVGGPGTPGPGEETSATLDLQPGTYAVLCVVPAEDGLPHIMKGMVHPLTVLPHDGPTAELPPADLVITLDDYSFAIDAEVTAGTRTLRVINNAQQSHEVVFVRLEPGSTPLDFARFVEARMGDPPGRIVGGTTAIGHGGMNQITLVFEPGEYALLCFVPDAADGQSHIVHGMLRQITVR